MVAAAATLQFFRPRTAKFLHVFQLNCCNIALQWSSQTFCILQQVTLAALQFKDESHG
jgi:hypothetical protein